MALLQDYNKLFEYTDNIKKIYVNNSVVWPAALIPPGPDYTEPFYVENISNTEETLSIRRDSSYNAPTLTIEYSTDRTTWQTMGTTSTTALTLTLQPNDKIYLRCNANKWSSTSSASNSIRGISKIGGNIMSLLYGSNFTGEETSFPDATSTFVLAEIFMANPILIDISQLLLPVTTLTSYCYASMFRNCISLATVPVLPATTLDTYCYYHMFDGCTSLTQAPALPATILTNYCYNYMFQNCTSLTTAPVLPATALANYCYESMFYGCTSLTTAPVLPATTLNEYCYRNMFRDCTSLTTAPVMSAVTLASNCCVAMFNGCTSLTTAPALPATTLIRQCYYNMFGGCTSLTTAPVLPATTLAERCYSYMFQNCTSLTTAPDLPATTLVSGCYTYMFKDCIALDAIKCLATHRISSSATSNWLSNVSSTGTFTKAAGATWPEGVSGIPSGWTVVEV